MSTALTRVARELKPALEKWGIKVDGEARHIEWKGINIDLEYGTPAPICRRKLKKLIAAAEKIDWESKQTSLIPMDQVQVAERSILNPEFLEELFGNGTLQVGDTKAVSIGSKFDGVVRERIFCEDCGDSFEVPIDAKLRRKELQNRWPSVDFGNDWDYSIYICDECMPDYLTDGNEE